MKKIIISVITIYCYILFYNIYSIYNKDLFIYITNPICWIFLSFIINLSFKNNKYYKYKGRIIEVLIIVLLLYNLLFYSSGFIFGFNKNPYSTNINGIVINVYYILLPLICKEIIRTKLLENTKNYKFGIYFLITLLFIISDINANLYLKLINNENLIDILFDQLLPVIITNTFLTFLVLNGGVFTGVIYRVAIIIPSFIIPLYPNIEQAYQPLINNIIIFLIFWIIKFKILTKEDKVKDKKEPNRIIIFIIISSFLMLFVLGVFNIKPAVILTASMKPNINEGDLILIKKCEIKEIEIGDIIEYKIDNYQIIHRVVQVKVKNDQKSLITKGDNNQFQDKKEVTSNNLKGCYFGKIPYIGYPSYFVQKIFFNKKVQVETGR